MVSLKVIYQLVLLFWFGSLVWIFSNISDLGYRGTSINSDTFDLDFLEQNGVTPAFFGNNLEPTNSSHTDDVTLHDDDVMRKEEIPAASLQCPLPEPSRAFASCHDNIVRLWDHGDELCYKKFGVSKHNDCSILHYLSQVERWCPMTAPVNDSRKTGKEFVKAKLRTDVEGILNILKHSYYKWMRNRVKSWWSEWSKAVNVLSSKYTQRSKAKKKILVFLGTFAEVTTFFFAASSGGSLGEMVQWTDLITSLYVLGHDVTVTAAKDSIPELLGHTDEHGCISDKDEKGSALFDIIFTDITGVTIIQKSTGLLYSRYKCRIRVVDSFGTDAEFNYHGYKKLIPGGTSSWGKLDLDLRQFMTMFPHSPDNSFLGFVSGVKLNATETARIQKRKRDQCLIYGKVLEFWRGKMKYIGLLKKYCDIHATTVHQSSVEKNRMKLAGFITNHGIVERDKLVNILQQSKVFVGLGFPFEGPAPLEAIANGAVFLNPKFNVPKNRVNTNFFKDKPTSRSLTSQSPYMEEFIGKPYVYTIDINNLTEVELTIKEIFKNKFTPFLPLEYTCEGMLERVDSLIQNQDFCGSGSVWPPLKVLKIILGQDGQSCKDTCKAHDRVCEPAFWEVINQRTFLKKLRKCESFETEAVLYAPSVDKKRNLCYIQDNVMLFSCVAKQPGQTRVCPCRDFRKEQVALCDDCA